MNTVGLKPGDKVQAVINGEITDRGGVRLLFDNGSCYTINESEAVSIEKVEPPVEVFGPGDVVRVRGSAGTVHAIVEDGCLVLGSSKGKAVFIKSGSPHDSSTWERVKLTAEPVSS